MNDRQKNHLDSYRATSNFLSDNASAFTSVPAIGTQAGKLKDSVALIDSLGALAKTDSKGATDAKAELLRQMIATAFLVAGGVRAYASEQSDLALKARVKLNDTMFHDAGQDEKDDIAQAIYNAASENVASLTAENITAATLSAFQTRIDAYRLSIPSPRGTIKTRKTNNELLDAELDRAGLICEERLDGLMEQFKESQPALYSQYNGTRDLIDRGHRKSKSDDKSATGENKSSGQTPPATPGK